MGDIDNDQISDKAPYIICYGHLKNFINCYFGYLGLIGFMFATAYKKKPKSQNRKMREDLNIDDYEDGEILMKPKGRIRRNISSTQTSKTCFQYQILLALFLESTGVTRTLMKIEWKLGRLFVGIWRFEELCWMQ